MLKMMPRHHRVLCSPTERRIHFTAGGVLVRLCVESVVDTFV